MNKPASSQSSSRRDFLKLGVKSAGLLAITGLTPSSLRAISATRPQRILVLVRLAGGNDGLNTLIPYSDPQYHRLRPNLAISSSETIPLNDQLGLNAACASLHRLWLDGRVGIVQGVGHSEPVRSHYRSAEIWETGGDDVHTFNSGWLARYFEQLNKDLPARGPLGVSATDEVPRSFLGQREPAFSDQAHPMVDVLANRRGSQRMTPSYRSDSAYPPTPLGRSLQSITALIAAGSSTRVYSATLDGFDTHRNQGGAHAKLLSELSDGLAAFQSDLESQGLGDQVLTMTWSEFGRHPVENEDGGTDHGAAAPLFIIGTKVKAGIHGTAPSLDPMVAQDALNTDFRSVYATLLEKWLGADSEPILGSKHQRLGFI